MAAITKSEADGNHPFSHYLTGDPEKPSTWGLRVKDMQGNFSHPLCGNAYAALYAPGGFRGNPYDGPDKGVAKAKLRNIYRAQKWDWPGDSAA